MKTIKNKTKTIMRNVTTTAFALSLSVTSLYAETDMGSAVKPYAETIVENIKIVANWAGLIMLAIALFRLIVSKDRDGAKESAGYAMIGYVGLNIIASIWGVVSGVGI